ncbi:MAG: hypothetical protein ABIP48_07765, partial [Planctomycetota bacterium]
VMVARRLEGPSKESPPAARAEGYALLDTSVEPPKGAPAADQVYIPVYCPLCNTMMHGTLDQVGEQLRCPDCNTPVVVPPPAPNWAKKGPVIPRSVDDEYALREEPDRPAPKRDAAPPTLIPVVCSLCATRMHATADQVGELITCPDCGTPVVVPRPSEPLPKPSPDTTPGSEYGVGEPVARTESAAPVHTRRVRIKPGEAATPEGEEPSGIGYRKPAPPRWPFASGIVNFLWHRDAWPRLLAITLGLLFPLPLLAFAQSLFAIGDVQSMGGIGSFAAMACLASGTVLFLLWSVMASAFLLAVVEDTAEGNDAIENWPEAIFSDWMFDFFFIFNGTILSLVPGVALAQVLAFTGQPYWWSIPASVFFVFPVALLSMLEAGSPLVPVSLPIWGSLFSKWWAWTLFYLETALVLAAFLVFAAVVIHYGGTWGSVLVVPAWVAILMIYFRLLGRLAWCCAQGIAEKEERDKDEEDDDDEDKADDRRPPREKPALPAQASPQEKSEKPHPVQDPPSSILDDDWQH